MSAFTALQAYEKREQEAHHLLERISRLVNDHTRAETVAWSHVGELAHVVDNLRDMAAFLADEDR